MQQWFVRDMRARTIQQRDELLPGACVVVGVIQARNVIAADYGGTSDPYCTIVPIGPAGKEITAEKVKTEVIPVTLNPVWDELFVVGQVSACA